MTEIFPSFHREDQAWVEMFARGFAAQRLTVWRDVGLRGGEAHGEVTAAALRLAKAVAAPWWQRAAVWRLVGAEARRRESMIAHGKWQRPGAWA